MQRMTFDQELSNLNDLKNHLLLLHQTIYDMLKKLGHLNSEIVVLEVFRKRREVLMCI